MNNNPTTHSLLMTSNHTSTTIPLYINPVLENSHATVSVEMTSASRNNHHNFNKISRMNKPPNIPVTQEPHPTTNDVRVSKGISPGGYEKRDWSSGLFSCFEDWSSCVLGLICPCCLAMTISCSLDECCCTANCYPVATRTKIRTEYNIVGTICEDAYIICWCYQCALCQMAREIDGENAEN